MKKKEKPKPFGGRLYKRQKNLLKSWAKEADVSEATVNRAAIEYLNTWGGSLKDAREFIRKFV